jgi:UrcA family protein
MNEKASSSCRVWLACAGFGTVFGANIALADKPVDLVVQADSSVITVTKVALGSPVHLVSLSRHISYNDINFNSPTADVELEKRVSVAAADICKKLDERFPDSKPSGSACVAMAVKDALHKVRANEIAAQRKASN